MQELAQKHIAQFFEGLGITVESVEVTLVETDVNVRVQTPDSALLIGMHGKNLESFQHLLGRILEKIVGRHTHLHLEVNDYMKAKDERLYRFLDSKIALATSTGKSIKIPNLTSYERKKAHSYIGEKTLPGLKSRSDGEGTERALFLEYSGDIIKQVSKPAIPTRVDTVASSLESLPEDGVGI